MSLILTLVIVLVVGALVANYYPAPKAKVAPVEETTILPTPEPEIVVPEPVRIDEPVATPTADKPVVETAPKMAAKPKKKRNYHHNSNKPKTNK